MPITSIVSINQLITWFEDFQENHYFLKDFGFGEPYDIGTSRQMDFPYMWVTMNEDSSIATGSNVKSAIPDISFSVMFMDKINNQPNYLDQNGFQSDNSQEILSDTLQCLQDLITMIQQNWGQYGVLISQDVSFYPAVDETQDKATGVVARIVLRTRQVNCVIPESPNTIVVQPNQPTYATLLTCESLDTCSTFQTYAYTGGTFISGTSQINLTSMNGHVISITGFTAGTSGSSGSSGVNGTSGSSGVSGSSGSSGVSGSSGSSGLSGSSGSSGESGSSGSSGSSGISGANGTSGTSGQSGSSGSSGVNGVNGTSGSSGESGTSGSSGVSGNNGSSGISGSAGSSGSSGSSGVSGVNGTSGSSGESGTSGSSGISGSAGTSGIAGATGTSGTAGTSGTSSPTKTFEQFTSNADNTVNAAISNRATWVASFTATRTINFANMTEGTVYTIFIQNTNASNRTMQFRASTTISGFAIFPLSLGAGSGGVTAVNSVNLSPTTGCVTVTCQNIGGLITGTIS